MVDFFAQQIVDTFVPVYQNGLRDLRNRSLAEYWADTPRSLPTTADADDRYSAIRSAATAVETTIPTTAQTRNEWLDLFPPRSGPRMFITYLTRQGLPQTYVEDLEIDTDAQLALRSPELINLSIQQQVRGRTPSVTYIQDILDRSQNLENLSVTTTNHLSDTEYPNDAFDADTGASRRVGQLTQYIVDLLGELS